ncbi:MAG: hypothetical protein Q8R18_05830 [bacterium]|nr:hypothetical protein [bacterium]
MQEIYVVKMKNFTYHTDGRIDDCQTSFVGIGINPKITFPEERLYDILVAGNNSKEQFGRSLAHTVNRCTFYDHEEVDLYFQRPSFVPDSRFSSNGLLGMSERRFESPLTVEESYIRKHFALSLAEFLQANVRVAQSSK